jgi:hypothetical protein
MMVPYVKDRIPEYKVGGSFNGHEFCSRPDCISEVIKKSMSKIRNAIEVSYVEVKR